MAETIELWFFTWRHKVWDEGVGRVGLVSSGFWWRTFLCGLVSRSFTDISTFMFFRRLPVLYLCANPFFFKGISGWWDGSANKGACHPAWSSACVWSLDPTLQKERTDIPKSPLTSTYAVWHRYPSHTHTIDKQVNLIFNKKESCHIELRSSWFQYDIVLAKYICNPPISKWQHTGTYTNTYIFLQGWIPSWLVFIALCRATGFWGLTFHVQEGIAT